MKYIYMRYLKLKFIMEGVLYWFLLHVSLLDDYLLRLQKKKDKLHDI